MDKFFAFGPFEFNAGNRLLRRDGVVVALGQRGAALLEALLNAEGQPVSKNSLLEHAWPGVIVEEVNLTVQIAALRKALGPAPGAAEWITTVPRFGYCLARGPMRSGEVPAHAMRPCIAVLPFDNFSGDPEQEYFADGVVEDVITALSRFRTFAIIARNSAFAYKGRAVDVRTVARDLAVRYVLEGSVRRRGKQVRVTAQLVDGAAGTQLWADKFDGDIEDLFAFQDRITDAVVGLIEPEVRKAEIDRARRKHPSSLGAYDLYLRALPNFRSASDTSRHSAIQQLEEAIELDAGFSMGLAYAAWAHERQFSFGAQDHSEVDRRRTLVLADAATAIDPDDPLVTAICGSALINVGGDRARGLTMLVEAARAHPNDHTVLFLAGYGNILFGDVDIGRRAFLRAIELAPGAPDNYESLSGIGIAHFIAGEYTAALSWLLRSMAANTQWPPTWWFLAASYAHLDRREEAMAIVARLRAEALPASLNALRQFKLQSPRGFDRMLAGLRKAGLAEA